MAGGLPFDVTNPEKDIQAIEFLKKGSYVSFPAELKGIPCKGTK